MSQEDGSTIGIVDGSDYSADSTQQVYGDRIRDNIDMTQAAPSPDLLRPDPFADFQKLPPPEQDRISLDLLREIEKPENKARLGELRPDFEMPYSLSTGEIHTFGIFSRYLKRRQTTEDEAWLSDMEEGQDQLDLERERGERGERHFPRPIILGFKLARFDRWELEEQIRKEREEAEEKKIAQDLPKAA